MENNNLNMGTLKTAQIIKILLWCVTIFEAFGSFAIFQAIFYRHTLPLSYLDTYWLTLFFPLFLWGCYQTNKNHTRLFKILSFTAFALAAYRIILILTNLIAGNTTVLIREGTIDGLFIIFYLVIGQYLRNISRKKK